MSHPPYSDPEPFLGKTLETTVTDEVTEYEAPPAKGEQLRVAPTNCKQVLYRCPKCRALTSHYRRDYRGFFRTCRALTCWQCLTVTTVVDLATMKEIR